MLMAFWFVVTIGLQSIQKKYIVGEVEILVDQN